MAAAEGSGGGGRGGGRGGSGGGSTGGEAGGRSGGREPVPPPGGGRASSDQIMRTGAILLRGFIQDRVERCRDPQALALSQAELGGPQISDLPSSDIKRLSKVLCHIADELDSNTELQRAIEQVQCQPLKEVFFHVAAEMFADGLFTWGRIIAFLYFACKLVLKAFCNQVPELVRTILVWTMEYLRNHLVAWIQAQGGWEGLLSHFGTPTWRTVTIVTASVLMASLTIWKMS